MNEEGNGYKIYRMNEIHNMLADTDVDKFADITTQEAIKYQLEHNDVLFNRTNSQEWVGRTGIFKKTTEDLFIFASYLLRLKTDENKILPEYLTTFFNSRIGIWDLKRRARISINQSNINAEEVKAIKIPLLSMHFQLQLRCLFDKAHEKRIKSQQLYASAEQLLLSELGLLNWQPDNQNKNIKRFSDFQTSRRLDAEYYQPRYEKFEKSIKNYHGGYAFIGDEFQQNKITIDYSEEQYSYIEIGDISISDGSYVTNVIQTNKLPANAKIKSTINDILISTVRPNRGAVAIIKENIPNLVVSGAFTVLREETKFKKEVLVLLLRTEQYKDYLMKTNVGSSYPVINDNDILNLPIPLIDISLQKRLASLLDKSFSLRSESERLLTLAKEAVETAIEQGEKKALKMLEGK
ncbi:MAG: restriction endonuclease subunit S [Planctomycetaceae bacterium]|nr:restriction endonuclease subunit S [Planctomycetaceae bacterium]